MIHKLEIRNLRFGYSNSAILKDLFMAVADGKLVSIVGPNGSGKSTLIKCIDRILTPSAGELFVDHRDLHKLSRRELARRIAYVPQNAMRVFPHSVFDVVVMGRRPHLSWGSSAGDKEKAWEMLQLLGIEDMALHSFNELSGGQQQKVLIARALAQETGLILLDEPTSNLDIWHQLDVMELLRQLVRKRRLTAIVAIHDLNMAARYSDRILMMKHGRILANGSPDEVMTCDNLEQIYGIRVSIKRAEESPFIIPIARLPQKNLEPLPRQHGR